MTVLDQNETDPDLATEHPVSRRSRVSMRALDWSARTCTQPLKLFALAFVAVFVSASAWSLATPLFASPDEPSHVVRAVALDHGQLMGNKVRGGQSAYTKVTVPASIADGSRYAACYAFKISVPASCALPLTSSQRPVVTAISSGHYPPLYYAVVGLPSVVSTSSTGVYLMRLASALVSSMFVALAIMAAGVWSRRPLLFVGVVVALTPMTLFLAGMVNPTGLEICSALCLWTSGMILAAERTADPPPGLLAVVAASAAALMLCRGISPLWVAAILILLAVVAGRRAVTVLSRDHGARIAGGVIVGSGFLALWWILAAHANAIVNVGGVPPHLSSVSIAFENFGQSSGWVQQMVGTFGWLDTPAPFFTYVAWYGAVGFVLVLAAAVTRGRALVALLLLLTAVIFVPVVISSYEAHRLGQFWQARYIMPLAVGLPIMATSLIDATGVIALVRTRLATVIAVIVGVASFAAFFTTERRYATGLPGPIDPSHGSWRPPLGNGGMALWSLAGETLLVVLVIALTAGRSHLRASKDAGTGLETDSAGTQPTGDGSGRGVHSQSRNAEGLRSAEGRAAPRL